MISLYVGGNGPNDFDESESSSAPLSPSGL